MNMIRMETTESTVNSPIHSDFYSDKILEFKQLCADVRSNVDQLNMALIRKFSAVVSQDNDLTYKGLMIHKNDKIHLNRLMSKYENNLHATLYGHKDVYMFEQKLDEDQRTLRSVLENIQTRYDIAELPVPDDFPATLSGSCN